MQTPDWHAVNPLALWRDWIVKSEAQWSQGLTDLLKDERTSGLLGRQIDEMRMMQRQYAEVAQASLAAANLPSRSDYEALDERMGRLEDGLAQVAAGLARLEQALVRQQLVASAAPRRGRRAPAGAGAGAGAEASSSVATATESTPTAPEAGQPPRATRTRKARG